MPSLRSVKTVRAFDRKPTRRFYGERSIKAATVIQKAFRNAKKKPTKIFIDNAHLFLNRISNPVKNKVKDTLPKSLKDPLPTRVSGSTSKAVVSKKSVRKIQISKNKYQTKRKLAQPKLDNFFSKRSNSLRNKRIVTLEKANIPPRRFVDTAAIIKRIGNPYSKDPKFNPALRPKGKFSQTGLQTAYAVPGFNHPEI